MSLSLWPLLDEWDRMPSTLAHRNPHREQLSYGLDFHETDDAVIVRAELPGYGKEDVSINVDNNELLISAEKSSDEADKGWTYHSYGKIQRRIRLPRHTVLEGSEAVIEHGVLNIRLPKTVAGRGGVIKVT